MQVNLTTIALIAALALSLFLVGKMAVTNWQLKERTKALNTELQQSNLEKGQALTLLGDANSKVSELEEGLQASIKDLGLQVTRYVQLEAKYKILKREKSRASVVYVEGPPIEALCEGLEFTRGLYYEAITHKSLATVDEIRGHYRDHRLKAECKFIPVPNKKRSLPFAFSYELSLRLKAQLVETVSDSGRINHFVNIYEVTPQGNNKFALTDFEVVLDDQRAEKWRWWVPHIDLGGVVATSLPEARFTPGASMGVSFMGYGKTDNDLSWRFPRIALDIMENPGLGLTPVLYNLGGILPVVSDLWLGPHVGLTIPGPGYLGITLNSML